MNRLKIVLLTLLLSIKSYAGELSICKEYFYIKESQVEEKQLFLEKILTKNPDNIECMLKLSSIYLRTKKVSQGFDLIRKAYVLDSKFVKSQNISKVLDMALKVSRLEDSALKNRDKSLWNKLGDIYFDIGIFDEAGRAYENSLKIDKSQTTIGILLALCDGNLDFPQKSEKRLREIVEVEPYNFYANYYLGKVLKNSLNNKKEGEKYLMMADYLINFKKPIFETKNEEIFLKNDLKSELDAK